MLLPVDKFRRSPGASPLASLAGDWKFKDIVFHGKHLIRTSDIRGRALFDVVVAVLEQTFWSGNTAANLMASSVLPIFTVQSSAFEVL
jgi:hypothetical protein